MPTSARPPSVLKCLQQAWNTHDRTALAACFHPDYESLHPLHPERNFWGREAAVASWAALFAAVPDLRAGLLRWARFGASVWAEWRWSGSHVNGARFEAGGMMVFGVAGERIRWARVYTEIAQPPGPDWDALLDDILSRREWET